MNETMETILNRHSVREYQDEEIREEDKKQIFQAILESPSAGNMQTYSVIEVRNQEKLGRLAYLCDDQPFIKDGKLVLLFVTNPLRYYEVYNETHEEKLKPTLADFYLNLNDALIAAHTAVLAGESLGIGSCYIGDIIENYEEIKKLFHLPKYVNPACLLVMGYKKKEGTSPKRFKEADVFSTDEFENDSLGAFVRKLEKETDAEGVASTRETVDRLFDRKMKAPFFREMNRSFELMLKEFKD